MWRQIGWELKKLMLKKSVWLVLLAAFGFVFFYIITCTGVLAGESSSAYTIRLPETRALYEKANGMTADEFAEHMEKLAPDLIRNEDGLFSIVQKEIDPSLSEEDQVTLLDAWYENPAFLAQQEMYNHLNYMQGTDQKRKEQIEKSQAEWDVLERQKKTNTYEARVLQKEITRLKSIPESRISMVGDHALSPVYGLTGIQYGGTPMLAIVTSFLILYLVSGMYSSEYRGNADALILTTKEGKKVPRAKIWATVLLSTFLCLFIQALYFALYSCWYQVDWSLPISAISSVYPVDFTITAGTIGQVFLVLGGMYLLGGVALGLFTLWLSSLSSYGALALGGGLLLLLLPYGMWDLSGETVQWLKALLLSSLQSPANLGLWFYTDLNVFGYPVPAMAVMTAVGVLALLALLWLPTKTFLRRAGVRIHKGRGAMSHVHAGDVGAA